MLNSPVGIAWNGAENFFLIHTLTKMYSSIYEALVRRYKVIIPDYLVLTPLQIRAPEISYFGHYRVSDLSAANHHRTTEAM